KKAENNKKIQQSLFDKHALSEFEIQDKKYILCFNPAKQYEDKENRILLVKSTQERLEEVKKFKRNYTVNVLQNKISKKISKNKCKKYFNYKIVEIKINNNIYGKLEYKVNQEQINEDEKYDGFYMIETTRKDYYYLLQDFRLKVKDLLQEYTLDTLLTESKNISKVYFRIDNIHINKVEQINELQEKIFKLFKIKL
ncbi:hypothetical protein VAMP_6856n2, partial [Candidatus Vampirococcus lugosii]|nr:hypothetical protein [Candidatus Vampirococcus lugosii]